MLWDTWALLSILALCVAVIGWSVWGFYREEHPGGEARFLRLCLDGSRYLEAPARGRAGRRHRGRHRTGSWRGDPSFPASRT